MTLPEAGLAIESAEIITTPDPDTGTIAVDVINIPEGFDYATVYRRQDGVDSTLVEATNIIDGAVHTEDHTPAPGWTVTYWATVWTLTGENLAPNPSVEHGDTWSSVNGTRKVRLDGSAHTGDAYYRTVATAGAVLFPAALAAVVPGEVTGADFANVDASTNLSVVTDVNDDYIRSRATGSTSTVSVSYADLITVAAGSSLFLRMVYRTAVTTPPTSAKLEIRVQYLNAIGTVLATRQLGPGTLTTDWTVLEGPLTAAPQATAFARVTAQLVRAGTDPEFKVGDTLDVAYMQAWPTTTAPTGTSQLRQEVPCTPGLTYSASAWLRTGSPIGVANVRVDLTFLNDTGGTVKTVAGTASAPGSDWMRLSSALAIAPDTATSVVASIAAPGAVAGRSFDVDDLYVTDNVPVTANIGPVSDGVDARHVGDAWLRDPANQTGMRVMVNQQPSLARAGQVGWHQVSGRSRPVAVTDLRSSEAGEVTLITTTESERDRLIALLAPGSVLLFQATPASMLPAEMYVLIDEATEDRIVQRVDETWRLHTLAFTVVDPPATPTDEERTNTYEDLRDYGVSYANVLNTRATYTDVLNTSFDPTPLAGQRLVVRI